MPGELVVDGDSAAPTANIAADTGLFRAGMVAETLIGLVVKDPTSYWHQPGSDGGRWGPADGAMPNGTTLDSMAAMVRATGQLDGAMA